MNELMLSFLTPFSVRFCKIAFEQVIWSTLLQTHRRMDEDLALGLLHNHFKHSLLYSF